MLKSVFKWILILVGALALLAALTAIFLVTPPGERVLADVVETQVGAALDRQVAIGKLSTNLLSRTSVHALTIEDTTLATSLLAIDSIRLEYSLWSLLSGRREIRVLKVDGLHLHIVRDRSGVLNVPVLTVDSDEAANQDANGGGVAIDSVTIGEYRVSYRDHASAIAADLAGERISAVGIGRTTYTFAVDSAELQVALDSIALPPIGVSLQGSGDSGSVKITELAMHTGRLAVTGDGSLRLGDRGELRAELTVGGDPNPIVSAIARAAGLAQIRTSDDLAAAIGVQGTVESPRLRADLSLSRVESYGTDIHDARLRADWTGRTLLVDTLSASVFGGRVTGQVTLWPDSLERSSAELHLAGLDVARLMHAWHGDRSPYAGRLSGDVGLEAIDTSLAGITLQASLHGTRLAYHDRHLPDIIARVALVREALTVDINQADLNVSAAVNLADRKAVGRFSAHFPDLSPYGALFELPDIGGSLDMSGRIDGERDNPMVAASVQGADLTYEHIPIDTLDAALSFSDSTLTINHAFIAAAPVAIDPFSPPLGIDSLTGVFGYRFEASGTLTNLSAHGLIESRAMQYPSLRTDSAAIFLSASGQTITIDSARVRANSLVLAAAGSFDWLDSTGVVAGDLSLLSSGDSSTADTVRSPALVGHGEAAFALLDNDRIEVTLVANDLAVGAIGALLGRPSPISGTANVAAEFAGTAAAPSGTVRLVLVHPDYRGVSLDSVLAQATLSPSRLRLDTLKAFGAGQDLSITATIQLDHDSSGGLMVPDDARVAGRVMADSIALVLFEPLLPSEMRLGGRASLDVVWQGTLQQPNMQGQVRLREVTFVPQPGADSVTAFTLILASEQTSFQIDSASGEYNAVPFSVAGSLDVRPWEALRTNLIFTSEGLGRLMARGEVSTERLDLVLQIDTLSLGLFEPFVPMIDTLDGTLSCDLTISGSPDDPEITGSLLSRNLVVKPSALDSTIHDGLIKVSFTRNGATIDSLYTTLGKGALLVTGTLAYDQSHITAVDLSLAATNLFLSARDYGWLRLDSSALTYTTTDDGFLLSGRVSLGDSRLTKDFEAELILPWTKEVETAPSDWPEFVKKTSLDVELRESNQLWLDNNLAKVRMRAAVGVIGSGARPNLAGQVTVEEGYLLYLDRKFTITQGSVLMSHPSRINPDVALTAETKVTTNTQGISSTTYKITFSATGPMDQLQYALTSEPPLDQANIVSLLTLGVLRDQLVSNNGQGGAGAGAVLTARAARLTSERLAGIASRQVESALGLEEFTVQGNLFDPQENGGPQLTASKRLSDRVKVTYLTTVGDANEQAIRVDYRLTSKLSLEGQTNRAGQAVLNIKYGLRFK